MHQVVTHELVATPAQVFPWVESLDRYPSWMPLVTRAEPQPGSAPPAWAVELTGRLGPFARSKRLRMVRTAYEPDRLVRFERQELDGRSHASWTLQAGLAASASGTTLVMELRYGGGLFGPVLERVLADQVAEGRSRLAALVSGGPPPGAGET